jgi:hypothetical protein
VRAAAGEADDGEAREAERIGELDDVVGPVVKLTLLEKRRTAEAGTVDGDDADAGGDAVGVEVICLVA